MIYKSWIDIIILIFLYLKFLLPKYNELNKMDFILKSIMFLYISLVLFVTLMPIIASIPTMLNQTYIGMNLDPFIDLKYGRGKAMLEIILNIIMMIPFGILYPLIKKTNLIKTTCVAFLMSLSIELIQPLLSTSRASDITDLITNTTGAILGYIIFIIIKKLIEVYRTKKPLENI